MIPMIGVMIGSYIFTRMAELILKKDQALATGWGGLLVRVFAVLTALVALGGMIDLTLSGSNVPPMLR